MKWREIVHDFYFDFDMTRVGTLPTQRGNVSAYDADDIRLCQYFATDVVKLMTYMVLP